jgi:hypothetical protein
MSDDDAFDLFRRLRWGEGKEVVCPHCGMAHRHYFVSVQRTHPRACRITVAF